MTIYRITWSVVQNDGLLGAISSHNSQALLNHSKNFSSKEKAQEYQKSLVDAAALLEITYLFRTALHEEVLD